MSNRRPRKNMLRARPAPLAIYPYFDKVQVWLKRPASRAVLTKLGGQCGHLFIDNHRARFGQGFRQRLEFKQPDERALQWIAGRDDALINRIEVALDVIFNDVRERDDAFEFVHRHMIRRWHGKKQKIKLVRSGRGREKGKRRPPELAEEIEIGQTRYDARRAPNKIVFYRNQYSRITGELICLHLEWHLNGARPVRSAGIFTGEDLLHFEHRNFWKKRLVFVDIDPDRLGRLIRNRNNGTRSRTPDMRLFNKSTINMDKKRGGIILRAYGSMQEIVDEYGSSLRLHRIMSRIPNDMFLPVPEDEAVGCE